MHGTRGIHCNLSSLKDIVCKLRLFMLMFYGEMKKLVQLLCFANVLLSNDKTSSIIIKISSIFDCHFSQVNRKMAIKNSVSNDIYLRSMIVLRFSIATYPVY